MNVLFVVGAFPPAFNEGGPGAMVYALSKQLVKSGCSVYVITTNKHVDEKLEYTDVLSLLGCKRNFFSTLSIPM